MIRIEGPVTEAQTSAGWLPVVLGAALGFFLIRKVLK